MNAPSPLQKRQQAYRHGLRSERLALFALMVKGFYPVSRRFRCPLGEIDLIMRRGHLVLIVEVKARHNLQAAMEAVSYQSQKRISAAADYWLMRQKNASRLSLRFDLVAVVPHHWPIHIKNCYELI